MRRRTARASSCSPSTASRAVSGPVHLNRALREAGLIETRSELGRDMLDAGASEAFAMCRPSDRARVREAARAHRRGEGAARAAATASRRCSTRRGSARTGSIIRARASSSPSRAADRWFTYYYWLDDDRAPDYARTVDIHRKPGYDPVELFMDPAIRFPVLKVGSDAREAEAARLARAARRHRRSTRRW